MRKEKKRAGLNCICALNNMTCEMYSVLNFVIHVCFAVVWIYFDQPNEMSHSWHTNVTSSGIESDIIHKSNEKSACFSR